MQLLEYLERKNSGRDKRQRHLDSLEAFRKNIWGNKSIFTVQSESPYHAGRMVEYLDFGEHFRAVRFLCPALQQKELVVVQEYRSAMETFRSQDVSYKNGACIVGQPGIGKSLFVAYAIVERLREKRPVAIQVAWEGSYDLYVLFTEDGASIRSGTDPELEDYTPDLWAFSDARVSAPIPPFAFTGIPDVRIFQTASLAEECHRGWAKEKQVKLYVMDLWSVDEIEDLIFVLGFDSKTAERVKTLSDRWGPVPRTVVAHLTDPEHEMMCEATANRIVVQAVRHPDAAVRAILNVDDTLGPGSSTVFFVKPLRQNDATYRSIHVVFVPTFWLVDKFVLALNNCCQEAQKVEFFQALCAYAKTRLVAGSIFEGVMHEFVVRADHSLPRVSWDNTYSGRIPDLPDLHSTPPFYWRAGDSNDPGIDGALVTRHEVCVLQTMINRGQTSLQRGVDKLWESMPPDKRALAWKLMFFGPGENQVSEFSKRYEHCLQVGDGWAKGSVGRDQGGIPRGPLPVGWFSVYGYLYDCGRPWATVDSGESGVVQL